VFEVLLPVVLRAGEPVTSGPETRADA